MNITESVVYVGVNDREIRLFEGQYPVPHGMCYNSYVIIDDKLAVMDSVEAGFGAQWLENIDKALEGRSPDVLIVQHMEPDHSGSIRLFMERYPNARVAASAKALALMRQFYGTDFPGRSDVLAGGGELCLGRRTLSFIAAPMVHWPEVLTTYDKTDKIFFSADAFGRFGTPDDGADWTEEARRYYFGIVGKFGGSVQSLLKKAAALDIRAICPLHGPVLTETAGRCAELYAVWSSYAPETRGAAVVCASIYGHTLAAAELLAKKLRERGRPAEVFDLTAGDMSRALAGAFRYDRLVLAAATYNGGVFPAMRDFIARLAERGFKNRRVGLVENGSWAPAAAKTMLGLLESCKNLSFAENTVTLLSAPDGDTECSLDALAAELCC